MKLLLTIALLLTFSPLPAEGQGQKRLELPTDFSKRSPPPISAEARRDMEAKLSEARARSDAEPNNPDTLIWVGRRLGYLGRFTEAIEVYSSGIGKLPRDARFYRHRGHRYITLRKFDLAIADFQKAVSLIKGVPDEVEPDGQPNARNIPTGTLHFNIWYHLGLAQYLTGRNNDALRSYRECLKVSKNPDSIVATTHWLYMTLRRLKRTSEAKRALESIQPKMDIIENDGYYKLVLMYKGLVDSESLLAETFSQPASPGSHSILYGLANWYQYNGRGEKSVELLRRIVSSDQWTSFGYIAAEVDLKRSRNTARNSAASAPSRLLGMLQQSEAVVLIWKQLQGRPQSAALTELGHHPSDNASNRMSFSAIQSRVALRQPPISNRFSFGPRFAQAAGIA